jgi:hypothetical protein
MCLLAFGVVRASESGSGAPFLCSPEPGGVVTVSLVPRRQGRGLRSRRGWHRPLQRVAAYTRPPVKTRVASPNARMTLVRFDRIGGWGQVILRRSGRRHVASSRGPAIGGPLPGYTRQGPNFPPPGPGQRGGASDVLTCVPARASQDRAAASTITGLAVKLRVVHRVRRVRLARGQAEGLADVTAGGVIAARRWPAVWRSRARSRSRRGDGCGNCRSRFRGGAAPGGGFRGW